MSPVLRIVRHCTDPVALAAQYRAALRMDEQGGFAGHDGYAATFLGWAGAGWHLAFVRAPRSRASSPELEEALALYEPDPQQWQQRVTDLERAGFVKASSPNPYWSENGASFSDIEGFRVIVARLEWPR